MENLPPDEDVRLNAYFTVSDVLGRGAFGLVLAATHDATSLNVAIKVTDKVKMDDPKLLHRCRAEGQVLRKLKCHPNIVTCFGVLESEACLYTVLQQVPGRSLAHILSARGTPFTEAEARPLLLQLARAPRHCHERRVFHRCSLTLTHAPPRGATVVVSRALRGATLAHATPRARPRPIRPLAAGRARSVSARAGGSQSRAAR